MAGDNVAIRVGIIGSGHVYLELKTEDSEIEMAMDRAEVTNMIDGLVAAREKLPPKTPLPYSAHAHHPEGYDGPCACDACFEDTG